MDKKQIVSKVPGAHLHEFPLIFRAIEVVDADPTSGLDTDRLKRWVFRFKLSVSASGTMLGRVFQSLGAK